jgi:hypothetical protein
MSRSEVHQQSKQDAGHKQSREHGTIGDERLKKSRAADYPQPHSEIVGYDTELVTIQYAGR